MVRLPWHRLSKPKRTILHLLREPVELFVCRFWSLADSPVAHSGHITPLVGQMPVGVATSALPLAF